MKKWFRSKLEKQLEKKMAVQKARMALEKYISNCSKDIDGYIATARKAKSLQMTSQMTIARRAIEKCMAEQRIAETQLLNIRLALGMQNRVESQKTFFAAMQSVASTVSASFKNVNIAGLQKDLTIAASKAGEVNQQMELFLETSVDLLTGDSLQGEDISNEQLSDDQFEKLLNQKSMVQKKQEQASLQSRIDDLDQKIE